MITLMPFFILKPAYAATDTTIPTLTAVVNNGLLTVDAKDDASGISAIYINGFEFKELDNGSITIRMQQYDTGYQYFTMQAKDGAGNLSEVYRVNNPYYTFPDEDNGVEVEQKLPSDAEETKPSDAEADVTDHVKTDTDGRKTDSRSSSSSVKGSSSSSSSSVKQKAVEEDDEDDEDYEIDSASRISTEGREFYTITTKSGKVFYLVIDRTKEAETVHFLTDITENDLLNVTQDNKPTLPQNSAVVVKDAGLADVSAGSGRDGEEKDEDGSNAKDSVSEDSLLMDDTEMEVSGEGSKEDELSPFMQVLRKNGSLFLTILIGILVIAGYMIMKFLKRDGDDDYVEDEEGEDADDGAVIAEEQEDDDTEDDVTENNDDFFKRMEEKTADDVAQGQVKDEPLSRSSLTEEDVQYRQESEGQAIPKKSPDNDPPMPMKNPEPDHGSSSPIRIPETKEIIESYLDLEEAEAEMPEEDDQDEEEEVEYIP